MGRRALELGLVSRAMSDAERAFSRRTFLRGVAVAAAGASGLTRSFAQAQNATTLKVRREPFLVSPRPGVGIGATSYYTGRTGLELLSRHHTTTRSDTADASFVRFSPDNGRTWSAPQEVHTVEKRPEGTFRRSAGTGIADPKSGSLIEFRIQGVFPTDTPLARLRGWSIHYAISEDGGRTWPIDEPVIHNGKEFSVTHPLPGVWAGKNCAYLGDLGSAPLFRTDGTLLLPIQIVPLGADGKFFNPSGGYTYTHAAVLRGRWMPDGKKLAWEMSDVLRADPAQSVRGLIEPTIGELADGRLLLVMRGSNEKKPQIHGGKWSSLSSDGGQTWTAPRIWTTTDGEPFFSPSSCSQLVAHSSGRLFWIGNITPTNPDGNRPRYPLVIGEVDRANGLLRKNTVTAIDDRREGDSELLALSNFFAREDRETGELVLHMSRQGVKSIGGKVDFTADAFLYRIAII